MGNYQVRFRGRGRGQSHRDPSPLPDELAPKFPDQAYGLYDLGLGSPELGWVSLPELAKVRGRFGLRVERDYFFVADRPLSAYAEEARAAGRIAA